MLTDFDKHTNKPSHHTTTGRNALKRYIDGGMNEADRLHTLLPENRDCCELLVACPPTDYSATILAKAVEDCDANVLALAVTSMRDHAGNPVVMLRANTRNAAGISRSLSRYGYETLHMSGEPTDEQRTEAMSRVNELLHYLEI